MVIVRHKFNAVRCECDGIKFPSKLEKNTYLRLKHYLDTGHLTLLLRQIGFDLDTGRHYVDFCAFLKTGDVLFIESKGKDLGPGKKKREGVSNKFGIEIHVISDPLEIDMLLLKTMSDD